MKDKVVKKRGKATKKFRKRGNVILKAYMLGNYCVTSNNMSVRVRPTQPVIQPKRDIYVHVGLSFSVVRSMFFGLQLVLNWVWCDK